VKIFIQAMCLVILSAPAWGQAARGQVPAPAPAPSQPADPDPYPSPITTLKVETRVVAISAVVTGKDGRPLGGLTKDDFVLRQDGKEEPIHYFSQGSELPLTIALMVDTSGSQRTFIGDESLASDIFFETMLGRKDDRAMLVQFDTSVQQLKGLTSSADALHLGLLRLSSHAATVGGTLLNDAVFAVAKSILVNEKGRKAMVILTDGGDNGSHHSLAEAIEQAQRADVQIYSILYSLSEGGSPTAFGAGLNGLHPTGADPGLATLRQLSETTGGRVFKVSPNLGLRQIYSQISQDLRLQYELGYTPPPDLAPNSYHKLDLKAKDKKLAVQARRGFFARP